MFANYMKIFKDNNESRPPSFPLRKKQQLPKPKGNAVLLKSLLFHT